MKRYNILDSICIIHKAHQQNDNKKAKIDNNNIYL